MAEYELLPASTNVRTHREASVMRRSGRSIEISRLISRSLRTVIDNTVLGERTLVVDCDVLQADGSTRTTAITGAYAALVMAQERWLSEGLIEKPFLKTGIAAVSIGVLQDGTLVLDPDYQEDSTCVADLNVIMTHDGRLIEMHGGAEKDPIDFECLYEIGKLARIGIDIFVAHLQKQKPPVLVSDQATKSPLFSLKGRHNKSSVTQ